MKYTVKHFLVCMLLCSIILLFAGCKTEFTDLPSETNTPDLSTPIPAFTSAETPEAVPESTPWTDIAARPAATILPIPGFGIDDVIKGVFAGYLDQHPSRGDTYAGSDYDGDQKIDRVYKQVYENEPDYCTANYTIEFGDGSVLNIGNFTLFDSLNIFSKDITGDGKNELIITTDNGAASKGYNDGSLAVLQKTDFGYVNIPIPLESYKLHNDSDYDYLQSIMSVYCADGDIARLDDSNNHTYLFSLFKCSIEVPEYHYGTGDNIIWDPEESLGSRKISMRYAELDGNNIVLHFGYYRLNLDFSLTYEYWNDAFVLKNVAFHFDNHIIYAQEQ